ncbi:MAG: hypothetical protein KJ588_01615, partial [Gammaproteobacteria bacterium]|nr:hypothetical protein [Gammaproteobacteria bacterium]
TSAPNVTYDDFIYDIYYQLKRDQFVSMKASPKARFNSSNMPSNWIFDLLKKSKNIPIQVFEKLLARVRRTNPDDLLTVIALFPEVKKENQAGPFVLHLLDLLELKHQDGTLDDKVTEVLLHGVGVVLKTNPLLFSDDEAAIQKKITAVSATIRSQPRHK